MGIDFLDCLFRIEKAFGIPYKAFDLDKLESPRDHRGRFPVVTCGHMHKWLELTLRENGNPIPEDCWPRLRACIEGTVSLPVEAVSWKAEACRIWASPSPSK
jgi:hypothetical protein